MAALWLLHASPQASHTRCLSRLLCCVCPGWCHQLQQRATGRLALVGIQRKLHGHVSVCAPARTSARVTVRDRCLCRMAECVPILRRLEAQSTSACCTELVATACVCGSAGCRSGGIVMNQWQVRGAGSVATSGHSQHRSAAQAYWCSGMGLQTLAGCRNIEGRPDRCLTRPVCLGPAADVFLLCFACCI